MELNRMCLFVLSVLMVFQASVTDADLVITEAMSDSAHASGLANGDWWELTNTGDSDIDLTGYYWDDDGAMGNDGALFGNIEIAAGESIVIVSEDDSAAFEAAWGGGFNAYGELDFTGPDTFSGLSSNSDQIEVWDSDPNTNSDANLVASVSFGAATEGFSFEWDRLGNFLGQSAAGVHGAFQAIDDGEEGDRIPNDGIDIGSPGVSVVPEPTAGLVLVGCSLLILRRQPRKTLASCNALDFKA